LALIGIDWGPGVRIEANVKIGLKIDVDTFRGTRDGVLSLCRILDQQGIRGTFFFSVGPDNMGRHLWRLARPAFLMKMLRSRAVSLYGWDILLRGTFFPGPLIGRAHATVIRAAAEQGHEVGLHAWDHHAWQMRLERGGFEFARDHFSKGWKTLAEILGREPTCAAAPSWKCNENVLRAEREFKLAFCSDCRGRSLFRPGKDLPPQVPTTLPTYDEVIGRNGIQSDNYNDFVISRLRTDGLNVLTIHAEVEGMSFQRMFQQYIERVKALGGEFVPLGRLVEEAGPIPVGTIERREIPGRYGWVGVQAE
jgi:undecaprenyl phosphate-alpha-L-ara4FN deformylase